MKGLIQLENLESLYKMGDLPFILVKKGAAKKAAFMPQIEKEDVDKGEAWASIMQQLNFMPPGAYSMQFRHKTNTSSGAITHSFALGDFDPAMEAQQMGQQMGYSQNMQSIGALNTISASSRQEVKELRDKIELLQEQKLKLDKDNYKQELKIQTLELLANSEPEKENWQAEVIGMVKENFPQIFGGILGGKTAIGIQGMQQAGDNGIDEDMVEALQDPSFFSLDMLFETYQNIQKKIPNMSLLGLLVKMDETLAKDPSKLMKVLKELG